MNDSRMTPPEVFEPLHAMFHFTLDPCTGAGNNLKLPRFFTEKDDGLQQSWKGERPFVNCPWSRGSIMPWILKAVWERDNSGVFSCHLLPGDHSTEWHQRISAEAWGDWRIKFRVKFLLPDGSRDWTAKFPTTAFFIGGEI